MTEIKSPLTNALLNYANSPAIITENYQLSFTQLAHSVKITIDNLRKLKISADKPVAIVSENSTEQVILLLALWHLKFVTAIISVKNPAGIISNQIDEIDAKTIFVDKKSKLNSILISELVEISTNTETGKISFEPIDKNQNATLIFTSGSSSKPKAVLHSYGNHHYSALGSNENIPLHQNDRWLLSLPLYHVGGLGIIFRSLIAGASIMIPPDDYNLSEIIIKNKITHLSLVATQLYRLLKDSKTKNLSSLKAILLGGSMIPSSLLKGALDCSLPIYKSYGMTEMASQICTTGKLNYPVKHSGKILSNREIKLSPKNEILVKGATLFKGYYSKDKLSSPFDSEGWLPTGDIGVFDNNQNLIVTGRVDNQFISGGENISPEEIENTISEIYDFENVMVVSIPSKDFGHRPVVFISGEFDQNEIVTKLKTCLPSYKIPDYFFKWPPKLPESSIKPSRSMLSEIAENLIKN